MVVVESPLEMLTKCSEMNFETHNVRLLESSKPLRLVDVKGGVMLMAVELEVAVMVRLDSHLTPSAQRLVMATMVVMVVMAMVVMMVMMVMVVMVMVMVMVESHLVPSAQRLTAATVDQIHNALRLDHFRQCALLYLHHLLSHQNPRSSQ